MVVLCVVKTQLKFLLEFSSVIQTQFRRGALLCVPQSLFGPPKALFFCRLLCVWTHLSLLQSNDLR
jgi:hypothetical protein